jgi:hypothetical protein
MFSGRAQACQCEKYPTSDEILSGSRNLQRAYVREMKIVGSHAVFYLRDVFVAKGKKRTSLRTSVHGASCGAQVLVPGYVWFSFDDNGKFHNCGGAVGSMQFDLYFALEEYYLRNKWRDEKVRR